MTKEIGHDQPWMDRIDCDICTLFLHYKLEKTCGSGSQSDSSGSYIGSIVQLIKLPVLIHLQTPRKFFGV